MVRDILFLDGDDNTFRVDTTNEYGFTDSRIISTNANYDTKMIINALQSEIQTLKEDILILKSIIENKISTEEANELISKRNTNKNVYDVVIESLK